MLGEIRDVWRRPRTGAPIVLSEDQHEPSPHAKGFVLTGGDGGRRPLETSRRGIFAIGDVRSNSVKRVAAAVGEGAQVVAILHAFLAGANQKPAATA